MSDSIVQGLTDRPVDKGQEEHVLNKEVIPVLRKAREIINGLDARQNVVSVSDNYTMLTETEVEYTGTGGHTITFAAVDENDGQARLRTVVNTGTGTVTLAAPAGYTINDGASFSLRAGEMVVFIGNGDTKWRLALPVLNATFQPLITTTLAALTLSSTTVRTVWDIVGSFVASANVTLVVDNMMRLRYAINAAGHTVGGGSEIRGLRIQPTVTDAGGATHKPFSISDDDGANPDLLSIIAGTTRLLTTRLLGVQLDNTTGFKLGTANTQKLGRWGSTPVVQPVMATGAGHTVDDVITMLQSIGDCRQS